MFTCLSTNKLAAYPTTAVVRGTSSWYFQAGSRCTARIGSPPTPPVPENLIGGDLEVVPPRVACNTEVAAGGNRETGLRLSGSERCPHFSPNIFFGATSGEFDSPCRWQNSQAAAPGLCDQGTVGLVHPSKANLISPSAPPMVGFHNFNDHHSY